MKELINQELIQIAEKTAQSFSDQSKEFEKLGDVRNAITCRDREIGVRTAINDILKAIQAA